MISILLQSLAVASVGILSPGSITIVILLLMSDKGWRNGLAYMSGYITMYALMGAILLTVGVNFAENSSDEPSLTGSIILITLGVLLLGLTIRNWRKPSSDNDPSSRFTTIIDRITPLKAFAFAATVAIINFKNLAIFLTAVSVLLLSTLPLPTQLTMLIPLVLIFCTSVIAPVVIYLAFPQHAHDYLNRIKETIDRYSRPLGIAVTLMLGLLFLTRALSGVL